jgi:lipopolysaccharide transport system ATP-binding protein
MSNLAIRVAGVGKQFRLGGARTRFPTLRDALVSSARRAGSMMFSPVRSFRERSRPETFWALRDVSFDVAEGDVVGIIGRNGAGKSTMLKILSRITEPTEGRVEIRGRVGSLLEVGTGFHPELTGRENTYLNGAILGMTRQEIARKFDEIVAFAEVERFIDTPVKHYSSGMYLRLAFAVAAHLEPEILIVDEVLAVGDASFQKKCLGKMRDVARQGRTVLFVSHNMSAVRRLCNRCILLDQGTISASGATIRVLAEYARQTSPDVAPAQWIDVSALPRTGSGEMQIVDLYYSSNDEEAGLQAYPFGPLDIVLRIESRVSASVDSLAITIYSHDGLKLINADLLYSGQKIGIRPGLNHVLMRLKSLSLNPGVYPVGLWIGTSQGHAIDMIDHAFSLDILDRGTTGDNHIAKGGGVIPCDFECRSISADDLASRHSPALS